MALRAMPGAQKKGPVGEKGTPPARNAVAGTRRSVVYQFTCTATFVTRPPMTLSGRPSTVL